MQRQRLGIWVIVAVVAFAGLGSYLGTHVGGGGPGYIALIGGTCAVLGSFLPGAVAWVVERLRGRGSPHQGPA